MPRRKGDSPVESLPQVPMWVWVRTPAHQLTVQIVWLSSDMPNPLSISQFKQLRNTYLQQKKTKEAKVARVRYDNRLTNTNQPDCRAVKQIAITHHLNQENKTTPWFLVQHYQPVRLQNVRGWWILLVCTSVSHGSLNNHIYNYFRPKKPVGSHVKRRPNTTTQGSR